MDDEPANVRALSRVLQTAGYRHVEATGDPLELLSLCRNQEPDLVLLDLGLPGMDGRDLLRLLAERGTLPRLRVVVVSAHASQATVESAMALGCRGYVYKPFGGADLRKAVAAALAE